MFGLDYLLDPLDKEEFLTKYWGKRAVVIQGSTEKFTDIFSWNEVNHFLNNTRTSYDGMRLLHEKKELPKQHFPDARNWLKKGATLVINSVNQVDPIVGRFNSFLARELNTQIHTNCYASYTSKQGFDTHYDQHDVFIVQVEGTKQWAVFEPTNTYPLHQQGNDKGNPPTTDPYIEYEMTPGDVLYIPRGHWHYAVAVSPSVHLTVGPQSKSGIEYLQWLVGQMVNTDEFLRKDFPVAGTQMLGGTYSDAPLEEHIEQFKIKLNSLLDDNTLRESLVQYIMTENPIRKEWDLPVDWEAMDSISSDREFSLHPEQKVLIRYDEDSQDAVVFARGNRINLDGIPKDMLAMIFESAENSFSVQSILEICPQLEFEKIRNVIAQLNSLGLILPTEEDN
ncbi:MAG: cupin domain-containing protein [Arenicella sp.]